MTENTSVWEKLRKSHVYVSSVAGSGKTTTMLAAMENMPDCLPALLLTYNSRLKLETASRAAAKELQIEVRSFHSWCCAYLDRDCIDDIAIMEHFDSGDTPRGFPQYKLLFVDEAQDVTPLFYKIIKFAISENTRICVVGDPAQSINEFKGADSRYLTLAPELYGGSWMPHSLPLSHRITNQMADFINIVCGQGKKISAARNGVPVEYFCGGGPALHRKVCDVVRKYRPENVMVLCSTGKNKNKNNPAIVLADSLSRRGIPVHLLEGSDTPESVLEGKVIFSTFHKAKGLERTAVILVGFDCSYYRGKDIPEDLHTMPNDLYVGCTRAKEYFLLVHTSGNKRLPFLQRDKLTASCVLLGDLDLLEEGAGILSGRSNPNDVGVTDLCEHITSECAYRCIKRLNFKDLAGGECRINLRGLSRQRFWGDPIAETVSDITGVAIPSWAEYLHRGDFSSGETLKKFANSAAGRTKLSPGLVDTYRLGAVPGNMAALLQMSNVYLCSTSSRWYKYYQISKYDWIQRETLQKAAERILPLCDKNSIFEENLCSVYCKKRIHGRADIIVGPEDHRQIVEIKCVDRLKTEHLLQVLAYLAICPNAVSAVLYNTVGDFSRVISASSEDLRQSMADIIHTKYHRRIKLSDEDFIRQSRGEEIDLPPCENCGTADSSYCAGS